MLPTSFLDIDFETRSKLDVTVVGAKKYVEHKSTRILMVSFTLDEGEVINYNPFFSSDRIKRKILNLFRKVKRSKGKIAVRAFNSEFEYWIHNLVGVNQFGWPELDISCFYDVRIQAGAMGFPGSLENAAVASGAEIQKNPEGKALIKFFSAPNADGTFNNPIDHPEKFKRFINYCDDDVRAQIAVAHKCLPLSERQFRVSIMTERMNIRGLPINKKLVQNAIKLVDIYKELADKKIQAITDGAVSSGRQTKVLQQWLNANGCDIPALRAEVIEKFLASPKHCPGKTYEVLQIRSNVSKTSIAKYEKALVYLAEGDRVHGFLKAFMAITGRWKSFGLQMHNYPKPGKLFPSWADMDLIHEAINGLDYAFLEILYGDLMEVLKAAARSMIYAPEGYKFVTADYSQIEARIVMWMADDPVGLADFSGEGKIYEGMAADIYGVPASKIQKPSKERDVGKETVLGCGFGMGDKKFYITCTEIRNIDIEREIAKKAVKGYRARYVKVPKAWKDCEEAAIKALLNPGHSFTACKGKLELRVSGSHLFCKIPSGRKIVYPFAKLKRENDQWGNEKYVIYHKVWVNQAKKGCNWQYQKTWGGIIFQKSVQGTAADIMADGMETAEKHGYPSLFTVHDEAASLVKEDFGSVKEYEDLLCQLKPWAKGIPVVSEGWQGKYYRK